MIITVTNQKGGIGKTTVTQALGYGLANRGYKTLLVDLDAQSNLTLAVDGNRAVKTSYDLMTRKATAKEVIQPLAEHLDIIAGSLDLSALDLELNEIGKEYRLKEALEPIKSEYDFIIIDTPPALNITTVNALATADRVLIPAQADIFSLDAVRQLNAKTIQLIKRYANNSLKIDGLLLTRYNGRNILTKEITTAFNDLARELNTKLYKARIREAIAVKESQTARQDIFTYAGKSNVTNDFNEFIDEFIKGVKE